MVTRGSRALHVVLVQQDSDYTQTYIALTDPGDGHVLGTTRFKEWMYGVTVHVEHLERPRTQQNKTTEPYRIPSIFDFARVRLHAGSSAPTTFLIGRPVIDIKENFLKLVNITAASATVAFYQGAAECKVSMEGLTTSQAIQYMSALQGQVLKKKKQVLSAAWNINQVLIDDETSDSPVKIESKIGIAEKAIDITILGGFEKIAWDGASNEYPSKCIMTQLDFREAVTIVHKAHQDGLITYFSAGFKLDDIANAVLSGVDGIGIGGAQVIRFMDAETGMHGPYIEETIPEILKKRDEASNSLRGKGVKLLTRLDTMFHEGSISKHLNVVRKELFKHICDQKERSIEDVINTHKNVLEMEEEGNEPVLGRAKRLYEASDPLLKEHFPPNVNWNDFVRRLIFLVATKETDLLSEEYYSDPWLAAKQGYWKWQKSYGKSHEINPFNDADKFNMKIFLNLLSNVAHA